MKAKKLFAALGGFALLSSSPSDTEAKTPKLRHLASTPGGFCARSLDTLPSGTCFSLPLSLSRERTLVIFLHGVIDPHTNGQWGQQLSATRAARARGYVAMTPKGMRGIGPAGMRDFWAWPTSAAAQRDHLRGMLAGWAADKRALEVKMGAPFHKTYVIGFSNGAYFLTSLAFQGALPVDGYAAFAGGSAQWASKEQAAMLARKPRFFVGYGEDDAVKADPIGLGSLLQTASWPSKTKGSAGTGHAMTDAQMQEAFDYLSTP